MELTYFEGQAAFLEDYQKVAKAATIDQQQVVDDVMEELNKPTPDDQLYYILPGDKTANGQAVRFPFRKELIAMDEMQQFQRNFSMKDHRTNTKF
ncbi:DUF5960 family protein [Enterococcus avium]